MGLNLYAGVGRISKITFKENAQADGSTLQICQINVPVNHWTPGRNGAQGTEETLWFEMTAFHNTGRDANRFNMAEKWRDTFHDRDTVSISGNPSPRLYSKGDGSPGFALKLNNPQINLVGPRAETPQDVAVTDVDALPF